jgi:DNA-directed RNA polymerase subunit RPC12/RpoP
MPILVECPRCKQTLSVADKMAGTSVTCAYCSARLLVPKSMAGTVPTAPEMAVPPPRPTTSLPKAPSPPAAGSTGAASPATFPTAHRSAGTATPLPQAPKPDCSQVQAVSPQSPTPPAPPPVSPPHHRVARFITAETARSTLTLNTDGKLPDLHLTESNQPGKQRKPENSSGVNPLVLMGLICLSMVASVMLVIVDVDSPTTQPNAAKWRARRVIEEEYFSNLDSPSPRERYQIYLRDAQRAHARGDRATERRLYRQVLDLLRAERGAFDTITGAPSRDKRLEEQIVILLKED